MQALNKNKAININTKPVITRVLSLLKNDLKEKPERSALDFFFFVFDLPLFADIVLFTFAFDVFFSLLFGSSVNCLFAISMCYFIDYQIILQYYMYSYINIQN